MAKVDIQHAYRNVPVHPDDRHLLGMEWRGRVFLDKTLPFGLRSAPKLFCALADALGWILKAAGVEWSTTLTIFSQQGHQIQVSARGP